MPDVDTHTTVDRTSSRRPADHLPDPPVASGTRRASPVRGILRASARVSSVRTVVASSTVVSALVALVLMALILVSLPLMSPAWGAVQTPSPAPGPDEVGAAG